MEKSDKVRILSHFSPGHEPFVILYLVLRFSEGAMSSPGHEIQSFFTSYLVPHFSEVWKCGIVRQSKDIVALFPQS